MSAKRERGSSSFKEEKLSNHYLKRNHMILGPLSSLVTLWSAIGPRGI